MILRNVNPTIYGNYDGTAYPGLTCTITLITLRIYHTSTFKSQV